MKKAEHYLDAAIAVVPKMSAADAIDIHAKNEGIFIDARDSAEIDRSGTIKNAHRIPRGMFEFTADPKMESLFNPVFSEEDAPIYLICGAGGQDALAGKTLKEMGYSNVTNIGGFPGWKDAGGPMNDWRIIRH